MRKMVKYVLILDKEHIEIDSESIPQKGDILHLKYNETDPPSRYEVMNVRRRFNVQCGKGIEDLLPTILVKKTRK